MLPEIKLVISEKNKVIESITKKTSTQPSHLVKSLEQFQLEANAVLSKMIENNTDLGDSMDTEDEEESDEEEDTPVSSKKRKK